VALHERRRLVPADLTLAAGANFQGGGRRVGGGAEQTTAAQCNFMSNVANVAYLKRIQLIPGALVQAYKPADIQKELAKAQRCDVADWFCEGALNPLEPGHC
jgi:hypothetical protein